MIRRIHIAAFAAISGFAITYLAYYPGLMTQDSRDQLQQAQSGHYADWHPPIMAWIWSRTDLVLSGPAGLFVLISAMYWSGFALFWLFIFRYRSPLTFLALVIPILPFIFNFAGTLWKDTLVFVCFLMATAIALWMPYSRPEYRILSVPAVAATLIIGCLARYNSALAGAPILMLYLHSEPHGHIGELGRRFFFCLAAIAIGTVAISYGLDRLVFKAEKQHPVQGLLLWDLEGLSQRMRENLLPGHWTPKQSEEISTTCYSSTDFEDFRKVDSCTDFVLDGVRKNGISTAVIFRAWGRAVVHHPLQYFLVRLAVTHGLFWPKLIFVPIIGTTNNTPPFYGATRQLILSLAKLPLASLFFTIGFWFLASAAVFGTLLYLYCRGSPATWYASLLISFSGGLYVWPLPLVTVANDFRYAYWAVVATSVALILAVVKRAQT